MSPPTSLPRPPRTDPMEPEAPTANILIVENEVAGAEAIAEAMTRVGPRCAIVHDGDSAVAKLASQSFDIVITDLMLGGAIDGLGVLKAASKNRIAVA